MVKIDDNTGTFEVKIYDDNGFKMVRIDIVKDDKKEPFIHVRLSNLMSGLLHKTNVTDELFRGLTTIYRNNKLSKTSFSVKVKFAGINKKDLNEILNIESNGTH